MTDHCGQIDLDWNGLQLTKTRERWAIIAHVFLRLAGSEGLATCGVAWRAGAEKLCRCENFFASLTGGAGFYADPEEIADGRRCPEWHSWLMAHCQVLVFCIHGRVS